MKTPEETLCFTCSLPLGDPPRLNHLSNGRVCPSCAERLLETLPPLLPRQAPALAERVEVEDVEEEAELVHVRAPRRLAPRDPELPPSA